MSYQKLHKELREMEKSPGAVRHLDLGKYGKSLDEALKNQDITQKQYERLNDRFMKL